MTAPDGSPVELYRRLRPEGEPELIHAAVPAAGAVLELGCGAGRITSALVALGHPVVAVDQSAAMLAHVTTAETVLADIETLDLGRRFPAVVLASHLVNTPDDTQRAAFLATCRRHVTADGAVLIERLDPEWARGAAEAESERDGVRFALTQVQHRGPLLDVVVRYEAGGQAWEHPWTARILDDTELDTALAAADLRRCQWLEPRHSWLLARPGR